jgi:hypothetical protein
MAEQLTPPTSVIDGRIRGRCLICGATSVDHDATDEGAKSVAALMENHRKTRHAPPPPAPPGGDGAAGQQ